MREKLIKLTKRTSFDLSIDNAETLKSFSVKKGDSYSSIVNSLISNFLGANSEIKTEFMEFCDSRIEEISMNMDSMSEFEKQDAKQKILQYKEFRHFFKEDQETGQKERSGMKKIYLKKGYVLIPDSEDWVILDNYSNPSDCLYAGVVETREPIDGKKKYNAKHFVFFSDYKYGSDYPYNMDVSIYAACVEKDPAFKNVLNAIVTPRYEGREVYSNMINKQQYKAAPCPGLFHIVEQGDPMYWDEGKQDYDPPFGAVIVR